MLQIPRYDILHTMHERLTTSYLIHLRNRPTRRHVRETHEHVHLQVGKSPQSTGWTFCGHVRAATRVVLEVLLSTRRGVAWLEAQPAAVGALLQVLHPGRPPLSLVAADTAHLIRCPPTTHAASPPSPPLLSCMVVDQQSSRETIHKSGFKYMVPDISHE